MLIEKEKVTASPYLDVVGEASSGLLPRSMSGAEELQRVPIVLANPELANRLIAASYWEDFWGNGPVFKRKAGVADVVSKETINPRAAYASFLA